MTKTIVAILCAGAFVACSKGAGPGEARTDPTFVRMSSDDQSETQADRTVNQQIVRRIADDPALSARTTELRITTMDGKVHLRGTVPSAADRDAVLAIVREAQGVRDVDDGVRVAAE